MTEQKPRGKRSAGEIQKHCCKNKLLPVMSQQCIPQTSPEQLKAVWALLRMWAGKAVLEKGTQQPCCCCPGSWSVLQSQLPLQPSCSWPMEYCHTISPWLQNYAATPGCRGLVCLSSQWLRLQIRDGNPHDVLLPQGCRGWRTAAWNADSPTSPLTQHSSVDFNYFTKEQAKNSLLWHKSPVSDIMPPPPAQKPCSWIFTLQLRQAGEWNWCNPLTTTIKH